VVEWLLIDDGLSSRKLILLKPTFNYPGIWFFPHKFHGFVTVIVLAEGMGILGKLLALGSERHYIK
jgi:hypothetical protein